MKLYTVKKVLTPAQAENLKSTFLDENSFDTLLRDEDADVKDGYGNILMRYRKNAIPFDLLKLGYESFKGAIIPTQGRQVASGGSFKRILSDGKQSKTTVGNTVTAGVVGYMDRGEGGRNRYCRKTAFTKDYFDIYEAGISFIEYVDSLYKELIPAAHSRQMKIAEGTNRNFKIKNTSFTTVTVNKNFQTAVHQDAGDYEEGFGNLCVYREGNYDGCYTVMPEYRIAVDMHNCDIVFMDVHKWHGNTMFKNKGEDYLRVSFVMYYRQNMIKCQQPSKELEMVQNYTGGFLKL